MTPILRDPRLVMLLSLSCDVVAMFCERRLRGRRSRYSLASKTRLHASADEALSSTILALSYHRRRNRSAVPCPTCLNCNSTSLNEEYLSQTICCIAVLTPTSKSIHSSSRCLHLCPQQWTRCPWGRSMEDVGAGRRMSAIAHQ